MRLTTHGFTTGVMNDALAMRFDVEKRNRAAQAIHNLSCFTLGPARRRPGFRHVATLVAGPAADAICRLTPFAFNREQQYVHCWTDQLLQVVHEDAVVTSVATPYLDAELRAFTYAQSGDIKSIAHVNHALRDLQRQGAHDAWALTTPTLTWDPASDTGGDPESPPGAVTFYEGRRYLAGFRDSPNLMAASWSSKINDFTEDDLDDRGFQVEMLDDRVSRVIHLVGGRFLTALTSGTPIAFNAQPLIPKDIGRQIQPAPGSAEARPARIDRRDCYITRADRDDQPQSLVEFSWDDVAQGFVSVDLGILAPHLIRNPQDLSSLDNLNGIRNEYGIATNIDGTLAILCSNRDEQVTAWSSWSTDGYDGQDKILSTAVVRGRLYAAIRRKTPTGDVITLEVADDGHELDASIRVTGSALTSVSDLDHLNDQTVSLVLDGGPAGTATVSDGAVTLPWSADTVEVGHAVQAYLQPMPPQALLRDGSTHGTVKRISRLFVATEGARHIRVNSQNKSPRRADVDRLDAPINGVDGVAIFRLLGWKRNESPVIYLDGPGAILGVTMEVQF